DARQCSRYVGAGGDRLSDRSRSDGAVGSAPVHGMDADGPFALSKAGTSMTKTRIIVVIGFVIAFVAGAVVGLQLRTAPVQATVQPVQGQRPSWLRSELNLSNEQNEQMKAIWEGLHNSGRSYEDRRH